MAIEVAMPQMGESVVEGTVTKWLVKEGDLVKEDQPLCEISTDKVDTEIPAPSAGTLAEVLVQEGQTVAINAVVGRIQDGTGDGASAADIVARASERHLAVIISTLGEERHARTVARAIVKARSEHPITTTRALADIVARVVHARDLLE